MSIKEVASAFQEYKRNYSISKLISFAGVLNCMRKIKNGESIDIIKISLS